MTELYARVPLWLALDGGVRALPPSARLALYDVALAGGSIRCGADPSRALDALSPGAGASLEELCSLGVIAIVDGRLTLLAPDGATSAVGAARASAALIDRDPTAALDRRAISKRLAARWSERGLRTVEARSAWIDSEQGRAYLDSLGVSADEALDIASTAGRRGSTSGATKPEPVTVATQGTPSARHVATDVATNPATATATAALPSALPSEERRNPTKKEPLEELVTNGVATNGVATDRVATSGVATNGVATNGVATNGVATSPRSTDSAAPIPLNRSTRSASESTTASPSDGAATTRSAPGAARCRDDDPVTVIAESSGGGVSSIAAPMVRMELVTFATANSLTREDFERLGKLLSTEVGRRKAWPWMKEPQRSVTASFLRGKDGSWSILASALQVARALHDPPAPRPSPSPAPITHPGPVASPDFIVRAIGPTQEVARNV